jgi:hypothetical protein
MGLLIGLFIAFCAALWTYKDAKRRGMRGASGWATGVFLLFIVFLPLYLATRDPLGSGITTRVCCDCGSAVPAGGQFCSSCGAAAPPSAPPQLDPRSRIWPYAAAALGLLLLMGMCTSVLNESPTAPSHPAPVSNAVRSDPHPSGAELALLSRRGYRTEGSDFMIVEGRVRNISSDPLRNVEAVANWYSSDGSFISSGDALVEYDPVLPGQTSPFKVMTRANPEMHRFSVEFKTFAGTKIEVVDRRGK